MLPTLRPECGHVSIGTAAPAQLFHVYKSTTTSILASFQNGTSTCTFQPASGAAWSCTSAERLKRDLVDTGVSGLVCLGNIRVRDFTMKVDDSRVTGVIAQEMLKTHPDMVHKLD